MRCTAFVIALGMIATASPVAAAEPDMAPGAGAPSAPADARYCLRIEPNTGSRIETIQCETREGWVELGLDLDKEWAEEGVRVET
jgi:hypothetical protein